MLQCHCCPSKGTLIKKLQKIIDSIERDQKYKKICSNSSSNRNKCFLVPQDADISENVCNQFFNDSCCCKNNQMVPKCRCKYGRSLNNPFCCNRVCHFYTRFPCCCKWCYWKKFKGNYGHKCQSRNKTCCDPHSRDKKSTQKAKEPSTALKCIKSVELRNGNLYRGCDCNRCNGLQDKCQRWCCMNNPKCKRVPPACDLCKYMSSKRHTKSKTNCICVLNDPCKCKQKKICGCGLNLQSPCGCCHFSSESPCISYNSPGSSTVSLNCGCESNLNCCCDPIYQACTL